MLVIATLLVFITGTAYAADDSLDKAAKKTENGMGELLKGMGQEVKKSGILGTKDEKKKDDKAAKSGDSQTKEDKK
jgi:hypothetical protein